jgi:hypothetical protein
VRSVTSIQVKIISVYPGTGEGNLAGFKAIAEAVRRLAHEGCLP